MTRLQALELRLRREKCRFLLDEVDYLGYSFTTCMGMSPTEEKVEAIRKAPEPKDKSQLRTFLGLVNLIPSEVYC